MKQLKPCELRKGYVLDSGVDVKIKEIDLIDENVIRIN